MTLRWQQAEQQRHALDADIRPRLGEGFRALCGARATTKPHGRHRDDCSDCQQVWREMQHVDESVMA